MIKADLHIHGRYSAATSDHVDFDTLSVGAMAKGIELLGSGDCLHPGWREEIEKMLRVDEGLYLHRGVHYVLTAEVETADRVHHLLFLPSMSKAEELYLRLRKFSENMERDGRPRVNISGEELALITLESHGIIGPAHAFTPYTGLFGYHDSLEGCYGAMTSRIPFVELGLSADTFHANNISELHPLTYLSNSDAHSPRRLGREFNVLEMEELSVGSLMDLLRGKRGRVVMNVGLPPGVGKYNESACARCHKHYTLEEGDGSGWKCTCGGAVKKGVRDRVLELRDTSCVPCKPPYVAVPPLLDIIATALGHSSVETKGVRDVYEEMMGYAVETEILLNTPLEEIRALGGDGVAELIDMARKGELSISTGGGGRYGKLLPGDSVEKRQSSLEKFF